MSGAPSARAVLGIDGCRGGWVWYEIRNGGLNAGLVSHLDGLAPAIRTSRLALIDIPIGLKDGGAEERRCDREARVLLGRPRASSVFRPPCRAALEAPDYATACSVNRTRTGVALSKQTWFLFGKIREADELLQRRPGLRASLREAHPEVVLWGLADGAPMRHNKKRREGLAERLDLLERLRADARRAVEQLLHAPHRAHLAPDDALDALALAIAAERATQGSMARLPRLAEIDATGLAMEMVYARTAAVP